MMKSDISLRRMRIFKLLKLLRSIALATSAFAASVAHAESEPTGISRLFPVLTGTKTTQQTPKYPLKDSRTLAHTLGAGDPQFFWINNDELLFLAIEASPNATAPNKDRIKYTVSRWDTRSGAISTVREFGENRPGICLYEGEVLYQVRRRKDDTLEAYHGKLGAPARAVDPKQYGPFCRRRDEIRAIPKWMEGREARRLEHIDGGFIDFGETKKSMENTPVRLYRYGEKQEAGIQLPFGRRDVGWRFPYYQFKDAFFLQSDHYLHPRPKEIPYPVYWLYRDGRIEKIAEVPWGPWRSSGSFFPFPTRVGLVMASSNFNVRNETDLAHAGLYLFIDGRVEKLLKGWIEGLAVAVSPDGCKIAFTYAPIVTQKKNVLQAMSLCMGK